MNDLRRDPQTGQPDPQDHAVTERRALSPEEARARSRRVLATGLALALFVVVVFVVTMARMHANMEAGL